MTPPPLRAAAAALALVLATAALPTAAPLAAQSAGDVEAEILRYQSAATDAYLRNDATAIDTLLADDFTLTDSRGRITSKADDVRAARAREVTYTEFRNVDQKVRVYGQAAVVTGRTLIQGETKDGTRIALDLNFTDTLVRQGGRWRMVASHVSRPPAP
jgi:ketosteroid isomerase-like protein